MTCPTTIRPSRTQRAMFMLLLTSLLLPSLVWSEVTTLARARASGDIKVADDGVLYLSDFGNPALGNGTTVVRMLADGSSQSVYASGLPRALAGNDFDSAGNLYQAAFRGNVIYRIAPDGQTSTFASITQPVGIVVDDNDVVYSTQCNLNTISRVDADGTVTPIASGGGLNCPNGIDIGHDGAFYVVNNPDGGMYRVGLDGSVTLFATIPGGGNGHVVFVNDHYYVAGRVSHRIYQVDLEGNVTPYAGTGVDGNDDGPNLEATISRPNGIGASPDGRFLYIIGSSDFTAPDLAVRQIDLPSAPAGFAINAGMSGAWFDPDTAGQGMLFDVIPATNTFFLAWFTYEEAQPGTKVGTAEHRWLTAQGPYANGIAELSLTQSEGGVFNDPTAVSNTTVGTATLSFISCTEASFDYAFTDGPSGSIDLIRLTPDELCTISSEP